MTKLPSKPKSLGLFLIAILLVYGWQDVTPNKTFAQTGLFVPEMTNVDKVFSNFMDDWNIPGGSIAIVKDGRLVYARGFGYADKESRELVQPDHLFRIASIAKPITAIAIMKLIDDGVINVDAKVFGHDGILNGPDYRTMIDSRVKDITVRHLLQHTSGWGFINGNQDPMFSNEHIAQRMGMIPPVGPGTIIKFMLRKQRLNYEPGTNYFYSNFGYCILGRIIEQISGKSYENYVKTKILNPLGISEMQLAQNLYENKAPNEVKYYDFPSAPLVNTVYRAGERVPFPYGGFNIEAMDSHGGWIASATDLVRLLVAVDGFDPKPDILNQTSIQLMTTPSAANSYYSMGWAVNPWGNWWHIGDLPGTSSILVRTNQELGWAVLFNTRPSNLQNFLGQMDNMVWRAIDKIDKWPTHDLFEQTIAEIEEAYRNEIEETSTTEIEETSIVLIPDSNLAAPVRATLGLSPNAPITKQAMQRLTTLIANNPKITNLTGLEHATQLESLSLSGNDIRTLNPLAGLTQLNWLNLSGNDIRDLSPLAGLTQLEWLNLSDNKIRDLNPLAGLTQLSRLLLQRNDIRDVSPLAKLINLRSLRLRGNPIKDTSPLASLSEATDVDIKIEVSQGPVVHVGSAQRPPMYWINAETGTLHRLVGTEVEDFVPEVQNATSITVDSTNNIIYWTEKMGKNRGKIKRSNLDGSNVEILATPYGMPRSIAVDTMQGMLYWTDSRGRIQQSNLNGKQIKNLIRNLDSPEYIVVDAARGKLYWTESPGNIRRANLNGKSIEDITSGLSSIGDIAISGNKIYWTEITDGNRGKIVRANLNGSNARTLAMPLNDVQDIDVDAIGKKIYWTDSGGQIRRSNLVGRFIKNVVSNLPSPGDFALVSLDVPTASAPMNTSLAAPGIPTPDATDSLSNYPNPFNPETWIPYQLAKSADVNITIYNVRGTVVRQLALGHQAAGVYHNRSRAAYWDGRNALGEPVANGIYFYTLTAGEFSATRKMLIRK